MSTINETLCHCNQKGSIPRVLTIAGTDPTGGAGSQADIKSITAAGGFALAVTTSLVTQNTCGVRAVFNPDPTIIAGQLRAVSDDVTIDGVKIGMLGNVTYIEVVRQWLEDIKPPVLVIDPVMVATSGDRLLDKDAESALRALLPLATVITPNIPELEVLSNLPAGTIKTGAQARTAAIALARELNVMVTLKAGHLDGREVIDELMGADGVITQVRSARINTSSTHGTGCSLSSALATRLAAGDTPAAALKWSVQWLHEAITYAADLKVGKGNGPVDHSHRARRLEKTASATPWAHMSVELGGLDTPATITTAAQVPSRIPAAGPWTEKLWSLAAPIMEEIRELPFIKGLRDGTLDLREFTAYQAQDAIYLGEYSRALLMLAALSHDCGESKHWATSGNEAIDIEQLMHERWLSAHSDDPDLAAVAAMPATPITSGYTDFLLARVAGDTYAVGAAAVLPCYWMYAEIGLELAEANHPNHPFNDWLSTYGDEEFTKVSARSIAIVERAIAKSSPEVRERAIRAYLGACIWEREFFDQTRRLYR